jgi:NAD(P)-dependent dehydrogenase (short-subunit alcohol dehydrogenase family)
VKLNSESKMNLAGKIVVITGGAGLLGRAFAHGIASLGGRPILADINFAEAQLASEELSNLFQVPVEAAYLDITNIASVSALVEDLNKRFGRIDAVVNNAYPRNQNYGRRLEDVTFEDFCENVNGHLGGYFLVAQQFCVAFKTQGYGNLVNMSSIYGSMAPRFEVYQGTQMTMPVEYAAIKSSVVHLTRYFAQYFKGHGIRVNCLSPGGILATQPPEFLAAYNAHCASKGMLAPEDVVGALLFLLSDESRFMTGQNLFIDDGFSI